MNELDPDVLLLISVFVFVFGACLGSFLNVCIHRIPLEISVSHPRSRCPKCKKMIAWYDNFPVLSFLMLRGSCRHCGSRISFRYPLIELLTAFLFWGIWLIYGIDPRTPVYMLVVFGLLLATFVDLDHMIIPDRVSIGGMLLGLIASAALPALHGADTALGSVILSLIGLLTGFGILWLVAVIGKLIFKKDAMGFGDVKLLGAIGAFLGWQSVLFTIMISSLAGSLVGMAFILSGNREWQSRIPYGPYLALAAVLWILWGTEWWNAYVNWVGGAGIDAY